MDGAIRLKAKDFYFSMTNGNWKTNGVLRDAKGKKIFDYQGEGTKERQWLIVKQILVKGNGISLGLQGIMELAREDIKIKRLNFIFNNLPGSVEGIVSLSPKVSFNLTAKSYLFKQLKGLKEGIFNVQGSWNQNNIKGAGKARLVFNNKKIEALIPNAELIFLKPSTIRVNVPSGKISIFYGIHSQEISFQRFRSAFELNSPYYQSCYFNTYLAEGIVKGKVNSKIIFSHLPELNVRGQIVLSEASVRDFEFLKTLARNFNAPSIEEIHLDQAATKFNISRGHLKFDDLILASKDLHLEGYFHVNGKEFVSSEFTLGLTRDLLKQSPSFRPILKRLKSYYSFPFDFRLSGRVERINLLWLDSPFKNEIKKTIPDFVERLIERQLSVN